MSGTQRLACRECIPILRNKLPGSVAPAPRAGVEPIRRKGFDVETDIDEWKLGRVERHLDLVGADPDSQRHRHGGRVSELQVLIAVDDGRVTAQRHVPTRAVRVDAVSVAFEHVQAGEERKSTRLNSSHGYIYY